MCDTSSYSYNLTLPSTLQSTLLVKNFAVNNQSNTASISPPSGLAVDGNNAYGRQLAYGAVAYYTSILGNIVTV